MFSRGMLLFIIIFSYSNTQFTCSLKERKKKIPHHDAMVKQGIAKQHNAIALIRHTKDKYIKFLGHEVF
jgi:hypothetical protein